MPTTKVTHVSLGKFKHEHPYEDQNCDLTLSQEDEYYTLEGGFDRAHEMPKAKIIGAYAHEDLLLAFSRLSSHLSMLCEFSAPKHFNPDAEERLDQSVFATGLSMKSAGNSCIITGFKILKDGGKLNLALSTEFDNPHYEHGEALVELCELIMSEGLEALKGKKKLAGQQVEMEFPGESSGLEGVTIAVGNRRRKALVSGGEDDLGF